jgi:subtilisin family serine protease
MHPGSSQSRLISKPLVFSLLLLAFLATSILFAPRSTANLSQQSQSAPTGSEKRHRPEFVPGEVLVRFKAGRAFEGQTMVAVPDNVVSNDVRGKTGAAPISKEEIPVSLNRFEGSDLVEGLRLARVAADDTMKAVQALSARSDVLYAEPNYIVHPDLTPNDPRFVSNELYGLTNIHAPEAWDITTGSSNVVVGVIDEGIDISHQDLQANIWTNPMPGSVAGITGDVNGYNFRDNNGTIPPESHATHVAGTIGAVGNNGLGVVGVNWQVRLMSLRFIDQNATPPSGTSADSIKAYNYAKQMRDLWVSSGGTKGANIRVLNASYSDTQFSQASSDAINAVGQSGILFVAAAGNEGTNNDLSPHYPASYQLPNVISVTATSSSDQQVYNFGPNSVLLGAPGISILSTFPGNNYGFLSGTSMATPHVTGAAALLCAQNPNLTIAQLRGLLAFNGDLIPSLANKTITGRRLNVFKSIQALSENDNTPPGTVSGFQIASQNGRAVNLAWTTSGDDGVSGQASLYEISFVDQTTNAVVKLTSIAPPTSGTPQTMSVSIPYQHLSGTIRLREFDNLGNEGIPASIPVSVDSNSANPYSMMPNTPAALTTGGTPLHLNSDDAYQSYSLPFAVPFFGQNYSTVTLSTNGALYFVPRSGSDSGASSNDLSHFKMVAGMWTDLDLTTARRADADIYVVQPDASTIIFRWQGVPCNDLGIGCTGGSPINFEIELAVNGTIKTRYGSGNFNLDPVVVGISGGEPDAYVYDALTSEVGPRSLTNAQGAVFTPASTCSYTLSQSTQTSGASGSSGSVNVTTQSGCAWNATSNAPWITITAGSSGIASGTVSYSVAPNQNGPARTGTITIAGQLFTVNQDATPQAVMQFSSANYSAAEGDRMVSFNVTRSGNTSNAVSVSFATSDSAGSQVCSITNSNASSRCDYISASGVASFAPGETSKSFSILLIDDSYAESTETFSVSLSNPVGGVLGSPSTATLTVTDNDSITGVNPVDGADFFVRQQYLDFLNREPDTPGLQFWTNEITSCGSNQSCIDDKRINVSAAFFLSIEFQDTGYLVERIYKAAYGDNPNGASTFTTPHQIPVPIVRLNEFLPDTQQIGRGVIVGQGNWQQQLESNKVSFTNEFVQRSRFTAAFPNSMTSTQFVIALNTNAGNVLSPDEQTQLINDLTTSAKTRAQVLRAVAEDSDLRTAEFNRAFVLMQFFGYLRRNPNDAPDSDYTGYDFWLTKLNSFTVPGDDPLVRAQKADMVKAFITSGEYRQRFGP